MHVKQLTADVMRRIRIFEAGHLATLWAEAQTSQQQPGPKAPRTRAQVQADEASLPASSIHGIRNLVEEGALSKAAKHLLSEGLADVTDPQVLEKLRALHPAGEPIRT